MSALSRKLEQIVSRELTKNIIPVKTENGIRVGNVLISSEGTVKNIWRNDQLLYESVYLNSSAIAIANMMAKQLVDFRADSLYRADQEYGKWYIDSQMLRTNYQKALNSQDFERADILWARYVESRDKAVTAKNHAQSLAAI